jgi:hypothetical protein
MKRPDCEFGLMEDGYLIHFWEGESMKISDNEANQLSKICENTKFFTIRGQLISFSTVKRIQPAYKSKPITEFTNQELSEQLKKQQTEAKLN